MRIFVYVLCGIISFIWSTSFALTPKEQKGVRVLKDQNLVYESPDWIVPFSLDQAPETWTFWKNILPYEEDRDASWHIVIPTLGIVAPIVLVDTGSVDYHDMISGREIDINTYLRNGVMHHAGTALPGQIGNSVIFGHSNFFKSDPGKYKSIFADLMNLDAGYRDEIRIFEHLQNGSYNLHKFRIEKSYETTPDDVSVLLQDTDQKELTVYTCTNGLEGRWIIKAVYREKDEMLIPYPLLWEMNDLIKELNALDDRKRKYILGRVLTTIEEKMNQMQTLKTYHEKMKRYVLQWMKKELIQSM